MKKYELTENTKEIPRHILYQIRALINIPERDIKIGDLGGYIQTEDNLSHEGRCWVRNNADVYDNACVFGDAQVYHNACVSGKAQVFGNARIWGEAHVSGDAMVYGSASVFDRAQVYDKAKVYGDTSVYNDAQIYGWASVQGNASVHNNAQVFNKTRVFGEATVYGDARVFNNAWVYGNATLSGGDWKKNPISIIGSKNSVSHCDINSIRIGCITLTFNEWLEQFEYIGEENGYTKKEIKEYKMYIKLIIKLNKTT